jgi:hypothetical protein
MVDQAERLSMLVGHRKVERLLHDAITQQSNGYQKEKGTKNGQA